MSVATAGEQTHPSDELSRDALLVMIQEQTQQIDTLEQRVQAKQHRINFLEEALRLNKQKRFGKSSEQNLLQGQLLFDEAESLSNQSPDDALPSGEMTIPTRKQLAKNAKAIRLVVNRYQQICHGYSSIITSPRKKKPVPATPSSPRSRKNSTSYRRRPV